MKGEPKLTNPEGLIPPDPLVSVVPFVPKLKVGLLAVLFGVDGPELRLPGRGPQSKAAAPLVPGLLFPLEEEGLSCAALEWLRSFEVLDADPLDDVCPGDELEDSGVVARGFEEKEICGADLRFKLGNRGGGTLFGASRLKAEGGVEKAGIFDSEKLGI